MSYGVVTVTLTLLPALMSDESGESAKVQLQLVVPPSLGSPTEHESQRGTDHMMLPLVAVEVAVSVTVAPTGRASMQVWPCAQTMSPVENPEVLELTVSLPLTVTLSSCAPTQIR